VKRFVPTPTGNALVDAMFALVQIVLDSFQKLVVTDDHLVIGIKMFAGLDTVVYHGLGQPIRTWDIVRLTDALVVYESPTPNPDPNNQIILHGAVITGGGAGAAVIAVRFT
jgi:hypothetical protein